MGMMKRNLLIYTLVLINMGAYSQQKETIDVCALISEKPAVAAFEIPVKKCAIDNKNADQLKKKISSEFTVNADVIGINSFQVSKNTFAEVTYRSKVCDTATVLFLIREKKKTIHSIPYKVRGSDTDFRIEHKEGGQIILYRKVKFTRSRTTISFEFNKAENKIYMFVDHGLSRW